MKSSAIAVCLLASTLPLFPRLGDTPLEVRIDIKPRMSRGVIPVRTMPYHATATVSDAVKHSVIGVVDLDLQPGETKTRTESASPFRILFRSKIGADGLRATAAATVWKGDQIVTRQSSDVSLER